MPAIIFLLAVLVVPGIPGSAVVPRWALLAITIPFVWYFIPRPQLTIGHLIGGAFLAYAALSLLWAFEPLEGAFQLGQFFVLGLIFCIGAGYGSLRNVYIAAGLGATANSIAVIAQTLGWDVLPQAVSPGGMFFNKNFVAEFAAMAMVGCLGLGPFTRWRWLALGSVPAIILCHSRGAEMALACAFILLIYQYSRVAAWALFAAVAAVGIYLWTENYTAAQRGDMWLDAWDGMTFWGRGIGQFFATFPEHATRIDALALRPSDAHNDLIQLTYELGPAVLALIALVVLGLTRKPLRTEHYVLVVFIVIGLVGFPLYMPASSAFAALVLGALYFNRPELQLPIALRRGRVWGGDVCLSNPGRSFSASCAGSDAGAVEPRHTKWSSVLFHGVEAVRPPLPGNRNDRRRAKSKPLRG